MPFHRRSRAPFTASFGPKAIRMSLGPLGDMSSPLVPEGYLSAPGLPFQLEGESVTGFLLRSTSRSSCILRCMP